MATTRSSTSRPPKPTKRRKTERCTVNQLATSSCHNGLKLTDRTVSKQKKSGTRNDVGSEPVIKQFLISQMNEFPGICIVTDKVNGAYILQIALPNVFEGADEFSQAIAAFQRRSSLRSRS